MYRKPPHKNSRCLRAIINFHVPSTHSTFPTLGSIPSGSVDHLLYMCRFSLAAPVSCTNMDVRSTCWCFSGLRTLPLESVVLFQTGKLSKVYSTPFSCWKLEMSIRQPKFPLRVVTLCSKIRLLATLQRNSFRKANTTLSLTLNVNSVKHLMDVWDKLQSSA